MAVPPDALDLTTAKTLLEMMGIAGVNFGVKLVMGVAGGGGSSLPTHKPSILMPRASALVPISGSNNVNVARREIWAFQLCIFGCRLCSDEILGLRWA